MQNALIGGGLVALSLGNLVRLASHWEDDIVEDVDTVSYKDFISCVKTGDLLLTSSTEISSITRAFTDSLWSHCGIAYWAFDPDSGTKALYEWSSHCKEENVLNSRGVFGTGGPQLVPVEFLASMAGAVFWRRVDMDDAQRQCVQRAVDALAYKVRFSATSEFLVYCGLSVFDGFGGGMACSHVVASTYGGGGVVDLKSNLSQYTPKSFSETGNAAWTVNVAPTKMVGGYDATTLIRLYQK